MEVSGLYNGGSGYGNAAHLGKIFCNYDILLYDDFRLSSINYFLFRSCANRIM